MHTYCTRLLVTKIMKSITSQESQSNIKSVPERSCTCSPSHQCSVSPARSCTRRPSELFRVRSVLRCAVFGGHLLDQIDKFTLLQTGSALLPPRGQESLQLQHSHFRQSIPAPVENRMLCVRRARMSILKLLRLQIFQTLKCSESYTGIRPTVSELTDLAVPALKSLADFADRNVCTEGAAHLTCHFGCSITGGSQVITLR